MRNRKKMLITLGTIYIFGAFAYGQSDIYIENLGFTNQQTDIAQFATPRISITIGNNGPDIVQSEDIQVGFVVCNINGQVVLQSSIISSLYIPVQGFWTANNVAINPEPTTQTLGQKTVTCVITPTRGNIVDPVINNNSATVSFTVINSPQGRYDTSLERSIEKIQGNLDPAESALGTQGVVNFMRKNIINILIPIIVIVGILIAIIGFYKMMFSDSDEGVQEGSKYIIRGVAGIMIMMSAWYLTNDVLFNNVFSSGDIQAFNGIQIAQILYNQAIFPFIKIAMYLALGVLFIIIVGRVISYLTSPSEDVKKQAATLIAWNIIGILIIMGAKQIVELVFGKESEVMEQSAQDLGDIGTGILSGNLPILYTIINRIMGIAAFVILVIIILQTYQLLTNPTNEENITKIKKSFLYIAIGILVIGAGYVITNFLIIN